MPAHVSRLRVANGDHHRPDIADFGNDQCAGIGQAVGVADVEKIPPAVRIADGGNVFGAWRQRLAGGGCLAADSRHDVIPESVIVRCIIAKAMGLKNMAKVIVATLYDRHLLTPSMATGASHPA